MRMDDMILVSVDDHVVEPPDMSRNHLTAEYQAKAPRVSRLASGCDVWEFNGQKLPNIGLNAVVGRVPEEYGVEPTSYEQLRKGCYDVHARVAAPARRRRAPPRLRPRAAAGGARSGREIRWPGRVPFASGAPAGANHGTPRSTQSGWDTRSRSSRRECSRLRPVIRDGRDPLRARPDAGSAAAARSGRPEHSRRSECMSSPNRAAENPPRRRR